nr:putative reverse transcriptase domain-containing protein [Tanacetum cinerariifolium]
MVRGLDKQFERKEDGGLYFMQRIWVLVYGNLRTLTMLEAHVHHRAEKMYYNLRDLYWWPGMKMDIAIGHDAIWVIVDRLTKSAHFLAIHKDYKMERYARLYINEIVERHGVPASIIFDGQNANLQVLLEEITIDKSLHFFEKPIEIIDREVMKLKQSRIPIVKVRWNSQRGPEFTWKREDEMRRKYPQLFMSADS